MFDDNVYDMTESIKFQSEQSDTIKRSYNQQFLVKCFKCYGKPECKQCRGSQYISSTHPMAQLLNDMLSRQLSSLANPQQLESVCSVIKEEITCSDCNDLCDNTYYNCTDCKLSFCAACAGLGQHQHPLSINQSGKKKKRKTCSEKPITVLTNQREWFLSKPPKYDNSPYDEPEQAKITQQPTHKQPQPYLSLLISSSSNKQPTYIATNTNQQQTNPYQPSAYCNCGNSLQSFFWYCINCKQINNHCEICNQCHDKPYSHDLTHRFEFTFNTVSNIQYDRIRFNHPDQLSFEDDEEGSSNIDKITDNDSKQSPTYTPNCYVEQMRYSIDLTSKDNLQIKRGMGNSIVDIDLGNNLFEQDPDSSDVKYCQQSKPNRLSLAPPPRTLYNGSFNLSQSMVKLSNTRKEVRLEDYFFEGIQCNECGQSPIKNKIYHCTTCEDYDLCSNCFLVEQHDISHQLKMIDGQAKNKAKQVYFSKLKMLSLIRKI